MGKLFQFKAEKLDSNDKIVKLRVRLNQDGYVVQFGRPVYLDLLIPSNQIRHTDVGFWEMDRDMFDVCCEQPLEDLRYELIIKGGHPKNLVEKDVDTAHPMQ